MLLGALEEGTMELEKRITKVEKLSYRILTVGSTIFTVLSGLALAAFGFGKLLKFLVSTW
jgi:hypothetical protein